MANISRKPAEEKDKMGEAGGGVRLRLGNDKLKRVFLAFALACTNFRLAAQVRLRLGNVKLKRVLFAIPLALH